MTQYRKKLIEVALPLEAINKASAREKSIRHGHPSTLHLWWARRPLAACRAVLFASLVDDPDGDPMFAGDENLAASKRAELFNLIEELVQWNNSNNPRVINRARAEIARCVAVRKMEAGELATEQVVAGQATAHDIKHMLARPEDVNAFLAEHAPPVLDPFCGGGSIPLEAQRLGLRAYASDLNPVAVLITKALIEIPPKFAGQPPVNPEWQKKSASEKAATTWHGAQGLAADVRYYGKWMRDEAEKRIGHLYPKVEITAEMAKGRPDLEEYVGQELMVIAWLWARTVASPSPAHQGIHVPLVGGYWLSKKSGKQTWVEAIVDGNREAYRFAVRTGNPHAAEKKTIEGGTKLGRGCKFRCLLSDQPIPESHVKSEGMAGRLGSRLMAVVAEGKGRRVYLDPVEEHSRLACTVRIPAGVLQGIESPIGLDKRAIWCLLYGLDRFDKLFTPRQLVALTTFSDLVGEARETLPAHAAHAGLQVDDCPLSNGGLGSAAYADAVATYLAFAVSKASSRNCTLAVWEPGTGFGRLAGALGRQALPMQWTFAETNPLSGTGGDICGTAESVSKVVDDLPGGVAGSVEQVSATVVKQPSTVCTDPPY